ncbi:MAG: zonular occludens toxin domain-containing protein [Methylococcus sp.]|nr:zonular occludens toxin domain-containing protein [Methylococcus sp.]
MITLITGVPGTGKTAFCVNELMQLDESRPLFIHAIPELKLKHEKVYCRSDLCEHCVADGEGVPGRIADGVLYVEDWHLWLPEAGILVVDECQRVWRPRASAAAVPAGVAKLETHRHGGRDIFILSQGPHLFDANVRRLVGRHIHITSSWKGRRIYEWPECADSTANTAKAAERPYRLPKKVFEQYRSATVHTPQKHAPPFLVYVFGGVVVLLVLLVWRGYSGIVAKTQAPEPLQGQPAKSPPPNAYANKSAVKVGNALPETIDFRPRQEGKPETAAAYDGLYRVSAAPIIMGCIGTPEDCRCYTVKATRAKVDQDWCRAFLRREVFYPYEPVPSNPHHLAGDPPPHAGTAGERK